MENHEEVTKEDEVVENVEEFNLDGQSSSSEDDDEDVLPFTIPKDVLPVNEIQQMVKVMWTDNTETNGRPNKYFVKCLFELLCAQACNTITVEIDPERMINIYELAATEFVNALETLPKKQYIMENLFQYFPDKKLPDEFYTYVETLQAHLPQH